MIPPNPDVGGVIDMIINLHTALPTRASAHS